MKPRTPSSSSTGKEWLSNFHPNDQEGAALLIDSLNIVSTDAVNLNLRQALMIWAKQHTERLPAQLLPVLSIEDIDRHLSDEAEKAGRMYHPPDSGHVAWTTYEPGATILSTPGSEGAIGNLIRNFTGDDPKALDPDPNWLHPNSDLARLRSAQCRTIVILCDYAGSGRQATRFAETIRRNPTIKSWYSMKRIRLEVLAFAASPAARAAMEDSPFIDATMVLNPGRRFDEAPWSPDQREEIERICTTYVTQHLSDYALGYKGSAGLYLTQSSIPNNLPAILWQTTGPRSPSWRPLFANRTYPPELGESLGNYQPTSNAVEQLALAANQARLSRAIAAGTLTAQAERMTIVLALLSWKSHTSADLQDKLQLPAASVDRTLTFLRANGFITEERKLTAIGRDELRAARISKGYRRATRLYLRGSSGPYYPRSLA